MLIFILIFLLIVYFNERIYDPWKLEKLISIIFKNIIKVTIIWFTENIKIIEELFNLTLVCNYKIKCIQLSWYLIQSHKLICVKNFINIVFIYESWCSKTIGLDFKAISLVKTLFESLDESSYSSIKLINLCYQIQSIFSCISSNILPALN